MSSKKSGFLSALRPFSLIVGLASCSLGVTYALLEGRGSAVLAMLVVAAGVLLQAGANLINDYADLDLLEHDDPAREGIKAHARIGLGAIVLGCGLGGYFTFLRGWPVLLLGCLGVLGVWGYAGNPINLKSRGLGLPAVFLLTGLLMVEGSYIALGGVFSLQLAFLAIPFSVFPALVLLANELRDYHRDREEGHQTFTQRFGYRAGAALFLWGAVSVAAVSLALAISSANPRFLLAALSLLLLVLPLRRVFTEDAPRDSLVQLTGRCYAVYAALFLWSLGSSPL